MTILGSLIFGNKITRQKIDISNPDQALQKVIAQFVEVSEILIQKTTASLLTNPQKPRTNNQ